MAQPRRQSSIFQGIYEFEDPSGGLLAARVPQYGSADFFNGTTIIVRPNQAAMLIYKGKVADHLSSGTHEMNTQNTPIITRLANWRKGFQSPIRGEIWFFNGSLFAARRWGTARPVMTELDGNMLPIRAFGNFNVVITDPEQFYRTLVGGRSSYDITDLEEFVQGHLLELLPESLSKVNSIQNLNRQQDQVSKDLEKRIREKLDPYGVDVFSIQILSLLPPKSVIDALDQKVAMELIGDPRRYLLYKAANSLEALSEGGHERGTGESMQMMLGLMLGKGLLGYDYHDMEPKKKPETAAPQLISSETRKCENCGAGTAKSHKFCPNCGKGL